MVRDEPGRGAFTAGNSHQSSAEEAVIAVIREAAAPKTAKVGDRADTSVGEKRPCPWHPAAEGQPDEHLRRVLGNAELDPEAALRLR